MWSRRPIKRDLDSGHQRTPEGSGSRAAAKPAEKSIAVLYLENLSGAKEDEYCRDGITEDIITELSKIKGLQIYPWATMWQPEVQVAQAWILYADRNYDEAIRCAEEAIERKRDCAGAYYILGRAMFAPAAPRSS